MQLKKKLLEPLVKPPPDKQKSDPTRTGSGNKEKDGNSGRDHSRKSSFISPEGSDSLVVKSPLIINGLLSMNDSSFVSQSSKMGSKMGSFLSPHQNGNKDIPIAGVQFTGSNSGLNILAGAKISSKNDNSLIKMAIFNKSLMNNLPTEHKKFLIDGEASSPQDEHSLNANGRSASLNQKPQKSTSSRVILRKPSSKINRESCNIATEDFDDEGYLSDNIRRLNEGTKQKHPSKKGFESDGAIDDRSYRFSNSSRFSLNQNISTQNLTNPANRLSVSTQALMTTEVGNPNGIDERTTNRVKYELKHLI
eukprot:TRINITY_DN613_c0_g2_i5.p1 TRINITY_DN613_c0_g2~~TRINITY_DN613_c0_g2_i5.p1  ORF type:complete len:307 (-),score=43.79 TRINITY_DN613_c0_g2_i5:708-1628(-)